MHPIQQPIFQRTATGTCLIMALFFSLTTVQAQPNTSIELAKPKQYANRSLPSEKTGDKKFNLARRIYNNTVSRFNYYFNANNQLNEIIERARAVHKDDYSRLLSFYDYSLDITAKDVIDTVIYKCNAGILLHDLRSDWVDNLYLLLGKAYLLRRDFDSATAVFRYINYAFAPKDDGYDIPLGSNASNTQGLFTVATDEKRSLWKKMTTTLPSRNESFLWQVRTYLEQQKTAEAAGLLELLRADTRFPARLQPALHELRAYWFYQQGMYDSAAYQLSRSLQQEANKQVRARKEFLAAQLYQSVSKDQPAIALYEQAISHATDPLMEVYARLNMASLFSGKENDALRSNLAELLKMAKRDRYAEFRDIIYYAAARLELQRDKDKEAQQLLLSSVRYGRDNPLQKQQSLLLLGDLNYDHKAYTAAYGFYDSIETSLLKESEQQRILARRPALRIISENEHTIRLEDSLQQLARLPAAEREALVRKTLRQLRKEKGLKESDAVDNHISVSGSGDLFGNNNADFYFLNTSLRNRGASEFKNRWGNRPNIDNWRRQAAVDRSFGNSTQVSGQSIQSETKPNPETVLTLESLLGHIPLTDAQLGLSNTAIANALLGNALTFQHQLEDYPSAVDAYETFLRRFPENAASEQALFNLSLCYQKTDAFDRADSARNLLKHSFPGGKYTALLQKSGTIARTADPAQQQYESVYRLFIEGRFDQAREAKMNADKQFGQSYWTPQLLYIEAISYIKARQDSLAFDRLQKIVQLFAQSAMAAKATTMIDVLRRRTEIENYLSNLSITKKEELVTRGVDLDAPVAFITPKLKADSLVRMAPPQEIKTKEVKAENRPVVISNEIYSFAPADSQYVMITMDKVDPVFISEGRNAFNIFNRDRYPNTRIPAFNMPLTGELNLLLLGPFANASTAVAYLESTRPLAATRIIPWLPADKYRFSIISPANLAILKTNKDMAGFRVFMQKVLPE